MAVACLGFSFKLGKTLSWDQPPPPGLLMFGPKEKLVFVRFSVDFDAVLLVFRSISVSTSSDLNGLVEGLGFCGLWWGRARLGGGQDATLGHLMMIKLGSWL